MRMTPSKLDAYRKSVHESLRKAGFDIDAMERERQESLANSPPQGKPFTTSVAIESATIRCVPPGFSEFTPHPHHGHPIRRCLARHPDGKQCGHFALKERRTCRRHCGASRHKANSKRGQHLLVHGNETAAKRRHRADTARKNRALYAQAVECGVAPAAERRGPRDGRPADARYEKQREFTIKAAEKRLKARSGP